MVGLTGVIDLALGDDYSCALLSDSTVQCWGNNGLGQLGDGTTTNHATPAPVVGVTGAASVATGIAHSCARLTDGTAMCWGHNLAGNLGDGTVVAHPTAVAVAGINKRLNSPSAVATPAPSGAAAH